MSARKQNHHPTTADASANRPPAAGRVYRTGPYSRALERGAVGSLNGNTAEAKFIKAYAAMLTEHVGGNPSIVQRALITRASRLACHLELMDQRSLGGDHAFTTHDYRHYIAASTSLARMLTRLGLQSPPTPQPSFEQVLADIANKRSGKAA